MDVVDATDTSASLDLAEYQSAAFGELRDATHLKLAWQNADFQDLRELHKLEYGESIGECAEFMLADYSYNVRRRRYNKNS